MAPWEQLSGYPLNFEASFWLCESWDRKPLQGGVALSSFPTGLEKSPGKSDEGGLSPDLLPS